MSTSITELPAEDPAPAEFSLEGERSPASAEPRFRRTLPPALQAGAPTWIWVGVGVAILGFILIVVGWGQVAAETQVYLQLPYVVSAALIGLGMVLVGLTVLNIATRQRDAVDRDRQIARLVATLEELRESLAERGPNGASRRR